MSRKNFIVATTEDGKTTLTKIDKTPTGKTKTLKNKEENKKAHEEQYKNFRINALKRRCKRYCLTEEQTKVKVEELLKQLDTPNQYSVLIMCNPNDMAMVKEAIANEGLVYKIAGKDYMFLIADQETLATIRSIVPVKAKINPYVIKKPSVMASIEPKVSGRGKKTRTKKAKKTLAMVSKKNRKGMKRKEWKRPNVSNLGKKKKKEFFEKVGEIKASWKAQKAKGGTTVPLKVKKGSESPKKASTDIKKAA